MSLKIGASIVSHLSANAATLARKEHISVRVAELQEEQLSIHKQATAEAVANAKVTIESLIAEAEAARAKAMSEKGGAAAAVACGARKWTSTILVTPSTSASSASLWSAPRSQRLGISPRKVATTSRPRKSHARCPAGIGQPDGYTSHSNGAGVSSAA